MALFQANYFSKALMRVTTFHMIVPNDVMPEMVKGNENYRRETKTLYMLHGFSGNSLDWMMGSLAQDMAIKYNLAIVMPSGENSFYLNQKGTGKAYATFVGEELVAYVGKTFGLSVKKEDLCIGGLSMGGFGAIHTGLKYKDTFGRMFGLSSALIIHDIENASSDFRNDVADYDYYVSTFGDLTKLEASENNPEYLIKQRKENREEIQPIFMACGTEDFLLEQNRDFNNFLVKQGVDVTYKESAGIHDWKFWNEYFEPAILWMLKERDS